LRWYQRELVDDEEYNSDSTRGSWKMMKNTIQIVPEEAGR
jgi:hypothetical protein